MVPLGWKSKCVANPLGSWNAWISFPLLKSKRRFVLSSETVATISSSGENLAHRTQLLCPTNELTNLCCEMVQILTDLSSEAVTTFLLSGLKSTLLMADVWALKSELRPSTLFTQRRTVLSREQDANRLPEGENLTHVTGPEWPTNLQAKDFCKKIMKQSLQQFFLTWML